jgi:indole-3-glycerol phosphate synthase
VGNILQDILARKREEVAFAKSQVPLAELRARICEQAPPRDFVGALREKLARGRPAVIAEIKKQSPSAGQFRKAGDFRPADFAREYERHGAACLSVLTDADYFGGAAADLVAARAACSLPVLRKDFMVDAYQLFEARAMGADAILLIIDALPIERLIELEQLAQELGLAVLAESHSEPQIMQALQLITPLIGVNNRDLTRFITNLDTTLQLAHLVPKDRLLVTESGIESAQAIDLMRINGISCFLVGGALMRAPEPGAALKGLFSGWPKA